MRRLVRIVLPLGAFLTVTALGLMLLLPSGHAHGRAAVFDPAPAPSISPTATEEATDSATSTPTSAPTDAPAAPTGTAAPPTGTPPSAGGTSQTYVTVPQPAVPPAQVSQPPADLPGLNSQIADLLQRYQGDVAVDVMDLQTGQTLASVNPGQPFIAASVIKIFTMMAVLRGVQSGEYNLSDVTPDLDAMMSYSDNQANADLTNLVGLDKINSLMQSLGMTGSVYCAWTGVPGTYRNCGDENYITARDLISALSSLYEGRVFGNQAYTNLALSKMEMTVESQNTILPARLPPGVTVAHKIGFIPPEDGFDTNVLNDAGIIVLPNGRAFAIVFLSQGNADYDSAYGLGADISWLVYGYFTSAHPATPTPTSTPTATPTATATQTRPATGTEMPSPTSTPTATPSMTPVSAPSPESTATPTVTASHLPTPTVTVTSGASRTAPPPGAAPPSP